MPYCKTYPSSVEQARGAARAEVLAAAERGHLWCIRIYSSGADDVWRTIYRLLHDALVIVYFRNRDGLRSVWLCPSRYVVHERTVLPDFDQISVGFPPRRRSWLRSACAYEHANEKERLRTDLK